jgi:hypothetical protein
MVRALCLIVALLGHRLGLASAENDSDLAANAALKYWQAFAQLPPMTDPEKTKLAAECATMPLAVHARELVTRSAYALRMLHYGAALRRCDWGIGNEEGINTLLPHASGARVLSALACLRARLRFEEGHNAEAVDDLVAAFTLGRHASTLGLNIVLLVGHGIEQRVIETLAPYLPRLSAAALNDLQARLKALPPGETAATALLVEEKFDVDWLARILKGMKDQASLRAFASQIYDKPEKSRAFLEECGGTAEGMLRFVEEMRASYLALAKKLDLPLDQFAVELEREERRQAGNPVFKALFPAEGRMRWFQARACVRRALLFAAIAVQLHGAEALKSHPDPVAGGSFEYTAFPGGFELRSKLQLDESVRAKLGVAEGDTKPLTLTIGRRGE